MRRAGTTAASPRRLLLFLAPLGALAALVTFLLRGGASFVGAPPAPIEDLHFERTILRPEEITVRVRNTGPGPVAVGQVLVNEAIWDHSIRPARTIGRLGTATITLASPWEAGQPLEIAMVTSTGLRFVKEIEVARETPEPTASAFAYFGLLGLYAGVAPVFLGLLWFPFLRSLGAAAFHFLLSLTVGLLAFLAVETLEEALEIAGRVPAVYQGVALILLGLAGSAIALAAAGARGGRPAEGAAGGARLASLIALGIGLHNLGEGLAIGSAHVVGEVALGVFLLVGFTLHNMTEGLAILAPLARERVKTERLAALGAIVQVVLQILGVQARGGGLVRALTRPAGALGLATGFLVMYGTGLLVSA